MIVFRQTCNFYITPAWIEISLLFLMTQNFLLTLNHPARSHCSLSLNVYVNSCLCTNFLLLNAHKEGASQIARVLVHTWTGKCGHKWNTTLRGKPRTNTWSCFSIPTKYPPAFVQFDLICLLLDSYVKHPWIYRKEHIIPIIIIILYGERNWTRDANYTKSYRMVTWIKAARNISKFHTLVCQ